MSDLHVIAVSILGGLAIVVLLLPLDTFVWLLK